MVRDAGLGVLFGVVVVIAAGAYFFFGGRDDGDLVALESFTPPPSLVKEMPVALERRTMPQETEAKPPTVEPEKIEPEAPPESTLTPDRNARVIPPPELSAETVASPASGPAVTAESTEAALPLVHLVDQGETLAQIAERYYHDAARVDWILRANPELKASRAVRLGMKLVIPKPPSAAAEKPPASPPHRASPKTASTTSSSKPTTYKVKSGDTLTTIAGRVLGDRRRWQELFELNKALIGKHPEDLRIGMILKLPAGASSRPAKPAVPQRKSRR